MIFTPEHPLVAMTLREAISTLYHRQADFAGRSARDEAGWGLVYVLAVVAGFMGPVAWMLFPQVFGRPDSGSAQGLRLAAMEIVGALALWAIFTAKPMAALLVRRMHDLDHSGARLAALLVPGVGVIVLLWWLCQSGTKGPNRFGPAPLAEPEP
jgi:uncharacterized membrane protein YhaH (DUF805 family)